MKMGVCRPLVYVQIFNHSELKPGIKMFLPNFPAQYTYRAVANTRVVCTPIAVSFVVYTAYL